MPLVSPQAGQDMPSLPHYCPQQPIFSEILLNDCFISPRLPTVIDRSIFPFPLGYILMWDCSSPRKNWEKGNCSQDIAECLHLLLNFKFPMYLLFDATGEEMCKWMAMTNEDVEHSLTLASSSFSSTLATKDIYTHTHGFLPDIYIISSFIYSWESRPCSSPTILKFSPLLRFFLSAGFWEFLLQQKPTIFSCELMHWFLTWSAGAARYVVGNSA